MPKRPLDVLEASVGDSVSVRLKDDTRYRGTLAGYDQHLNVVLEAATTGDRAPAEAESVEDTIVIRGDNVVSIVP